jgi:HD-like signal output (HDOD) protein
MMELARLVADMERLPVMHAAAMRVIAVGSDPEASAGDLADALSRDPSLLARVLRLANSAYYGVASTVRSPLVAVSLLGFPTVSSIAAAGLAVNEDAPVPDGFWEQAAETAVLARLLAPTFGAHTADAFSVGLLHDLGGALLYRADPDGYVLLPDEPQERLAAERDRYGMTHAEVGERVLGAWKLPADLASAVGSHHDPVVADTAPLTRTLAVAAAMVHGGDAVPTVVDLADGQVAALNTSTLRANAEGEAAGLAAALG